jgi:hypothetical protein
MSINFDALLSDEQKRSVLEQRIQQFAVEAYQLTLNRKVTNEESLAELDGNLEILENAINAYVEELTALPQPAVTE